MSVSALITLTKLRLSFGKSIASNLCIPHFDASSDNLKKPKEIIKFIRANSLNDIHGKSFILLCQNEGLSLAQISNEQILSIRADFHSGNLRYRQLSGGGKSQMIAKAVGIHTNFCPHILDATGGLGRDAFTLASLGCRVDLIERVPELHALIEDGFSRAIKWSVNYDANLIDIIKRIKLVRAEAQSYMQALNSKSYPEVIYLDPMFPQRKKSALVKKEMIVLKNFIGYKQDEFDLLATALNFARKRVVVKRPRYAQTLGGKPCMKLLGKSNRYDIYFCD